MPDQARLETDPRIILALRHMRGQLQKPGDYLIIENKLRTIEEGERLKGKLQADLQGVPVELQTFFTRKITWALSCASYHLLLIYTREG